MKKVDKEWEARSIFGMNIANFIMMKFYDVKFELSFDREESADEGEKLLTFWIQKGMLVRAFQEKFERNFFMGSVTFSKIHIFLIFKNQF